VIVTPDQGRAVVLERFLASGGYVVGWAESASEAVDLTVAEPPDVIVVDVDLLGIEALRTVRAGSATHLDAAGVVVLAKETERLYAIASGADEVVAMPAHISRITSAVNAAGAVAPRDRVAKRVATWRELQAS
jgi:DNA-binding response OmpR family regulator